MILSFVFYFLLIYFCFCWFFYTILPSFHRGTFWIRLEFLCMTCASHSYACKRTYLNTVWYGTFYVKLCSKYRLGLEKPTSVILSTLSIFGWESCTRFKQFQQFFTNLSLLGGENPDPLQGEMNPLDPVVQGMNPHPGF